MTWGNRLFWGLIFFFGFHLLFFVFYMLKYGPRPKEKEEERKGA